MVTAIVLAALSFLGVFLCTLAVTLHLGESDLRLALGVAFSVGVALVWPVVAAVALFIVALCFCAAVLYLPVGIVAALRGKPLVSVNK
jgi:hypothetical protein